MKKVKKQSSISFQKENLIWCGKITDIQQSYTKVLIQKYCYLYVLLKLNKIHKE